MISLVYSKDHATGAGARTAAESAAEMAAENVNNSNNKDATSSTQVGEERKKKRYKSDDSIALFGDKLENFTVAFQADASMPIAKPASPEEILAALDEISGLDTEGAVNVTPEEMRSIIEVIADTGKCWHDWDFLKRLLSLQLKQVLAEYSEAQMVSREDGQQQNSLSGETCSELFVQLNDALMRFEEGPPFTLQRLCEILLDPKGTYTKLSKIALALEKNLLVTSTMTKCTDPYPGAHRPNSEGTAVTKNTGAVDVESERLPERPTAVSNGTEHIGDGDEEMADAETEGLSVSHDVEMQEKLDQIADVNSDANSGAAVACETVNTSEKLLDPQS